MKMDKSTSKFDKEAKKRFTGKWKKPDLLAAPQEEDPNYRYRWVAVNDKSFFVNGKDPRGWEIVKTKDVEESGFTGNLHNFDKSALNSVYNNGGMLYARMPKEIVEERNAHYQEVARLQAQKADNPLDGIPEKEKHGFLVPQV